MTDRVHVLKDHGITPTLKRVIFLQRTLARHLKRELQPIHIIRDSSSMLMSELQPIIRDSSEMLIDTTQSEQNISCSSSDVALVGMVSDLQRIMRQQQQAFQDLLQQFNDQQERLRKLKKAMQEPQHTVQEDVRKPC
jgi:hypothetical protein